MNIQYRCRGCGAALEERFCGACATSNVDTLTTVQIAGLSTGQVAPLSPAQAARRPAPAAAPAAPAADGAVIAGQIVVRFEGRAPSLSVNVDVKTKDEVDLVVRALEANKALLS